MEDRRISYITLFSGFWLWIILIQNNPQGVDLLDATINYVNSKAGLYIAK